MSFVKLLAFGKTAIRFIEANLLVILFIIAVFTLSVNQLQEYDAWFHLKTGEYIVTHLTVPTHDIFSYTAPGVEWVTHSWLPEVIFFLIYKLSGLWGLIFFCALIGACTYYLMIRLADRWSVNKYVTLFFLFLMPFLRVAPLFIPRPHIFSYVLLLVEILLLEGYLATKDKKYVRWLPLLFFMWANTHASINLGLVVLVYYLFFAPELWKYALASLAISFVNPNTYKIFTYQFALAEVAKTLRVSEWFSIWGFRYYPGTRGFFIFLFLTNLWCVVSALRKRTARNLRFAGLMLGFSALPFVSVRHIGYFPLVAFPVLAAKLGETKIVQSIFSKISLNSVKFALVFFTILFIISGYLHWPKRAVSEVALPVKAVDFIMAQHIKGPVFNLYNEGGYLIWRLWPEQGVFIDGRSEIYRGEPLKDYLQIFGFGRDWDDLVNKKYKINYFLIPTTGPLARLAHIAAVEYPKRGFLPVYLDDAYAIFVRNNKENADLIKKFGIDPEVFLGESAALRE